MSTHILTMLPQFEAPKPSQRALTIAAVVAVHAIALLLLGTASFLKQEELPTETLQVVMLDADDPQRETVRPKDQPRIDIPEVPSFVPTPVVVETVADSSNTAPVVVTQMTSAAPAQTESGPITVTQVAYVRPPVLVYPPISKKLREQGTVLLRVLVDESGRPTEIQLQSSSGYSRLDSAAQAAVRQAEFKPYEISGTARRVYVLVPLEYALRS